jgi:phosphoribosylamine--glycine ligase
MFIKQTEKTKCIARGMVEIVEDFKEWLRWADLIFLCDNTKYLRDIDSFRKEADVACIIGPSQDASEWELDREKGMAVLMEAGVQTPPYECFDDYDEAIEYVKKHDKRFVSKPSGDADKRLSYCAKTPEDMVFMLERWKKAGTLKAPFILQEFIDGCEMAIGGWFGPSGWSTGWCENFEFKKLMNNDLGVATGEQGTVLRYVRNSKLARRVLEPVTDALERLNYVGYVDINCIIDDKGIPWPLEFTMRPGWPTFNIQQALHQGDSAQWLHDLANGIDPRNWILDRVAVGVVLSVPDYPYSHLTRKEVVGVPIYGITDSLWDHLHLCECMWGEAPAKKNGKMATVELPVTAGDYVLVMSGVSETIKAAADTVYQRLKTLTVPNSPMYRTDIGRRLRKELPTLQGMGYATGLKYSTRQ